MSNKILLGIFFILFPFLGLFAQQEEGNTYKTPERLFHISRSANKNLVCYDINLENGKFNAEKPLKVYWINREEHPGKRGELSFIQRKFAYGYKLVSSDSQKSVCSLTAYPSRKLIVTKQNNRYVCLITIDGQQAELKSLYVKASPSNPLSVEYVELHGISQSTNQPVTERVKKE